jgi:hypothetical protein
VIEVEVRRLASILVEENDILSGLRMQDEPVALTLGGRLGSF